MSTSIHRAAVTCALLLASGLSSAREPDEWGPYVQVDLGSTSFNVRKSELDAWSEVPAEASSLDRSSTGFSLAAGFRFSQYLAVEAAYLDLGSYSYRFEDAGDPVELDFGSRGPTLAVIAALPINDTWSLEARAGAFLGKSRLHGWISLGLGDEGLDLEGSGGSDPDLLLGAGVVGSFGGNWSVRLGYDYMQRAASFKDSGLDSHVDTNAGRVSLGVRYRF